MLRYREALGLLHAEWAHRAGGHRHYDEADLATIRLVLVMERDYDISPTALAFAMRMLAEPDVARRVRELGTRLGRLPAQPTRALDFEKQRALRRLNGR